MKLTTISALTACAFWTCPAQSFDLHTHVAMTAKAVEKSALGVNPASSAVISRLGLTSPDAVFGRRYIGFALPQKYGFSTDYEGDVFRRVQEANVGTTPNKKGRNKRWSASFDSQLQGHQIELHAEPTGHAGRARRNN